jgi:hypothetical protein
MVWLYQSVALAISAVVAPSFRRRSYCLAALAGPGFLPGFRGRCQLLRAPPVPARSVFSRQFVNSGPIPEKFSMYSNMSQFFENAKPGWMRGKTRAQNSRREEAEKCAGA